MARRWEKHGKHVINKAEHLVLEYSAETFSFQQVWERDENLSMLTPHHSKNLGEPVCPLLSAPLKAPDPETVRQRSPERGPSP